MNENFYLFPYLKYLNYLSTLYEMASHGTSTAISVCNQETEMQTYDFDD